MVGWACVDTHPSAAGQHIAIDQCKTRTRMLQVPRVPLSVEDLGSCYRGSVAGYRRSDSALVGAAQVDGLHAAGLAATDVVVGLVDRCCPQAVGTSRRHLDRYGNREADHPATR